MSRSPYSRCITLRRWCARPRSSCCHRLAAIVLVIIHVDKLVLGGTTHRALKLVVEEGAFSTPCRKERVAAAAAHEHMQLLLRLFCAGDVLRIYRCAHLSQLLGISSSGPQAVKHGGQSQPQRHLPPLSGKHPAASDGARHDSDDRHVAGSVVNLLLLEAQGIKLRRLHPHISRPARQARCGLSAGQWRPVRRGCEACRAGPSQGQQNTATQPPPT
mmetsp:Transcript_44094/g.82465  ORF Transcript_44094/g.82465 Transcript_44094/m.82465 type:complete len:216 (-) Transcript_44094:84-731(-)